MVETGLPDPQTQKAAPKIWDLEDEEFEYAPPKPQGDPWNVLLKPLLEKDKIKCNGWKEEVQNLLIFAGLFSAVVTAFVVESYKSLRQDPNDAIVGLLSHIASRLDNLQLNETAAPLSFPSSSFTPTPSSIRVNIFWFLSLILSLTTVLVGIVSLQWLREYQSYPGLSPKDTHAIFRMRSEGMDRWYVWNVFVALPLLLQAALVLFLGGIIDFLLALESNVAAPVAVVVGTTLLFLIATTVLPTFQGLFLYLPFLFVRDLRKPPSQCPYKSPQSAAFRTMLSFSFTLAHRLFPTLRPVLQYLSSILRWSPNAKIDMEANDIEHDDHHVFPELVTTWQKRTWIDFDAAWLSLRDACAHGLKDRCSRLKGHRDDLLPHASRLFDSLSCIQEAIENTDFNQTDAFRSAIYHCFADLSQTVLAPGAWLAPYNLFLPFDDSRFHRQHRYFHALWNEFDVGEDYDSQYRFTSDMQVSLKVAAIHHQNLYSFIRKTWKKPGRELLHHAAELQIRLGKCWAVEQVVHSPTSESVARLPRHFVLSYAWRRDMDRMLFWQYSHVPMSFFEFAARAEKNKVYPNELHNHPGIVEFLQRVASITAAATRGDAFQAEQPTFDIELSNAYSAIFSFIGNQLRQSLISMPIQSENIGRLNLLYLFYTSAIYVRILFLKGLWTIPLISTSIESLLPVMRQFRERTIDVGFVNDFLERRFKGEDDQFVVSRFSKEWWSFLDDDSPYIPESSDLRESPPLELDSLRVSSVQLLNLP
ncbi:hypothetical protein GALMADRAFT_143541 [Galerina marginata CBS 339.88]|uniref:DUF6535 domain-containing protein n=1 Tax=Galerina marginata (strain CBS 339.88) TaxID=685588 RepID=A0A067SY97_GALM3|nr:hypothetical protein GALMADRAFT_143541 [Galerina marginata CBS 339.88]